MNELLKELLKLIEDEVEAIEGYNKSLTIFAKYPDFVAKLKEIKTEEEIHIKELSELIHKL